MRDFYIHPLSVPDPCPTRESGFQTLDDLIHSWRVVQEADDEVEEIEEEEEDEKLKDDDWPSLSSSGR